MEKPVLLEGRAPHFTREALQAHSYGTVRARCVILPTGRLDACKIITGVPHQNDEVLRALATHRYRPVTVDGQPVSVFYLFTFQFKAR
jgi:periplasmic protein TonB